MPPPSAPLDRLRDLLDGHPEVLTAYLFGSMATGAPDPGDADLAVVLAPGTTFRAALELQSELEAATGVDVDLHDFERLPVDLQFRVIQEGRVLLDRDPARRVRLEVRTHNAFNDFRPYLERLRTAARDRVAAGPGDG